MQQKINQVDGQVYAQPCGDRGRATFEQAGKDETVEVVQPPIEFRAFVSCLLGPL